MAKCIGKKYLNLEMYAEVILFANFAQTRNLFDCLFLARTLGELAPLAAQEKNALEHGNSRLVRLGPVLNCHR